MIGIDCCILRRSPQSLARQSNAVFGAEVSVIGIDVDAVGAYSLWIAAIGLFVLLGLCNQVVRIVLGVPADTVQQGKANTNANTDFGTKINSSSCLATNRWSNVSLNQIDDAITHAASLAYRWMLC